jgi:ribosomal protein S18 acetylase RimI-like enzyme
MTEDEVVVRADANYFQSMRTLAPLLDGGETREWDGLLVAATGLPVPFLNIAFVTRPLRDPEGSLQTVIEYFDRRELPFVVRVRDGVDERTELIAEASGLPYQDAVPGMALSPLPPTEAPALEIRTVSDPAALRQYARVLAGGFGMPAEMSLAFAAEAQLQVPDYLLYLGYLDGQPVATSALLMSHRVAGVYNVATLPEFRKRGIGEAMTWHALRDGLEAGCLLGSLQASEMGRPVYERMGFQLVAQYKTFVRPEFTR